MTEPATNPAAATHHAQPRTDEQHRALAGLQLLYGEAQDDIQRADRLMRRSMELRAHLVARMVAVLGDQDSVAQTLGQPAQFVRACVMHANGHALGRPAPQVPTAPADAQEGARNG